MKDRVPTQPGRVKLTFDGGSVQYAILERADAPTQVGTPLNKATFLNDAVGTRYGLDEDGTVNDALGNNVRILTCNVPLEGWSASLDAEGWYTNQVTINEMKAAYNPILALDITSAALVESEQSAFAAVKECETFDGHVIFKALEVPEIAFSVKFMGV